MRILICTPYCYPEEGGLETHVSMLCRGLRQKGHQVEIYSLSSIPVWVRKLTLTGPALVLNKVFLGWGQIWFFSFLPFYFWMILHSLLKKTSLDVINVQHVGLVGITKKLASRYHLPVILTVHGDCTNEHTSAEKIRKNSLPERFLLTLEKEGYKKADRVATVDQRLEKHVKGFIGENQKVTIIQNFVDTSLFSPKLEIDLENIKKSWSIPLDKKVILCPRRLVKKNGVTGAALAMDYIVHQQNREDVVLIYAGEGKEKAQIEKLIEQKKLRPYIKFLGVVKHSEMHLLYPVADVVVIPSTYSDGVVEATSIAALEAMASGVPVVATCLGGLKEIIEDGKNGLLFPDRDYNALAESILKIVDDKKLGQTLGREGRNSVMERNSLQRGTDRFLEVYRRTIEVIHSIFNFENELFS